MYQYEIVREYDQENDLLNEERPATEPFICLLGTTRSVKPFDSTSFSNLWHCIKSSIVGKPPYSAK